MVQFCNPVLAAFTSHGIQDTHPHVHPPQVQFTEQLVPLVQEQFHVADQLVLSHAKVIARGVQV